MTILSKEEIRNLGEEVFGEDYDETRVKSAMYDLRLGAEYIVTPDKRPSKLIENGDDILTIPPGQYALLTTYEHLKMPTTHIGFISLKFSYAKKGLLNISGFHVDPGYKGKIIFSVYNLGPSMIHMKLKDSVFMIFFEKLEGEGNYEEESPHHRRLERIPLDMISDISRPIVSIPTLDERLKTVENYITYLKILGGALFIIIIALMVLLANLALK